MEHIENVETAVWYHQHDQTPNSALDHWEKIRKTAHAAMWYSMNATLRTAETWDGSNSEVLKPRRASYNLHGFV